SMRCALFAPIVETDEHFGQMVETAIIAQWLHSNTSGLHYAAWKGGEVDIVMVGRTQKPKWVMEVKWSNQYFQHPNKLKSLVKYISENKLERGWVTTIDEVGTQSYHSNKLYFVPAATYAYSIAKNSILERGMDTLSDIFDYLDLVNRQ
ncbi:MAG: hypothetical protein J7497_14415, partial [Chitinophagaceae bacterium]|nr:hypothetical protein [Chitinophagaceae bacterium]